DRTAAGASDLHEAPDPPAGVVFAFSLSHLPKAAGLCGRLRDGEYDGPRSVRGWFHVRETGEPDFPGDGARGGAPKTDCLSDGSFGRRGAAGGGAEPSDARL